MLNLKELVKKDVNMDSKEEIRRVRTRLLQNPELKTLTIVSSTETSGKFNIAYDLAGAFSKLNKRVALVDFDLRSIESGLTLTDKVMFKSGIDDYLTDDVSVHDLGVSLSSNFTLFTNKTIVEDSSDYLQPEKLIELYEYLKANFDYVFVHTTDLLRCYDALVLGKYSDGYLFVKEEKKPSKMVIEKHAALLKETNVPVIGVIISNITV